MAVPVLTGRKTARERFAGATTTWTCEGMMGDGKALQMATSHELGQNFAKAFGITYADQDGELVYAWQTSWGASTRLMGALVMTHGDDAGLVVPPRLAPVQAVVLLVRAEDGAGEKAAALAAELGAGGVRVELDDRTDTSFGRRVVGWELKGVPVRIEVGPRDLAAGLVTVSRRDTGTKEQVRLEQTASRVAQLLHQVHQTLLDEAQRRRQQATAAAATV
jgi:prolyl-tRNA synthetase